VPDKTMTLDDLVGELSSGMTIGLGGWGSRRKPMAAVRAIVRSGITDLTVVSYGGPDIGLLCAVGKVRRYISAFATLDSIPLEPHFRAARQNGAVAFTELDEGMLYFGLLAAAHRLPFLPTRAGLGSDVLQVNPELRTVRSPYDDGEELVAAPALRMDAAIVHVNRADRLGNGAYLGPDPYFDDLFCKAAERAYLTCEQIIDTAGLAKICPPQALFINRAVTHGVIEVPGGAHFTSCVPDYERDERFQRAYAEAAADPAAWAEFHRRFLQIDEDAYRAAVLGQSVGTPRKSVGGRGRTPRAAHGSAPEPSAHHLVDQPAAAVKHQTEEGGRR
jgi:acyl CoA:acetate/3-ketoacid CoA transferase alpha subunit